MTRGVNWTTTLGRLHLVLVMLAYRFDRSKVIAQASMYVSKVSDEHGLMWKLTK